MSTPDTQASIGRRVASLEYQDGRVETLVVDSPLVTYQVARLGITDEVEEAFVRLWMAAGKPGLDGQALTQEVARQAMEAWLAEVKVIDAETEAPNPPSARKRK